MSEFTLAAAMLATIAAGLIAVGVVAWSELDEIVEIWEARDDGEE